MLKKESKETMAEPGKMPRVNMSGDVGKNVVPMVDIVVIITIIIVVVVVVTLVISALRRTSETFGISIIFT